MRRRVRKVVGWVLLLLVAVAVGGGWFAYSYVTDSETLRAAIREGATRFLPECKVEVQRVQVRPFAGKVVLNVISLRRWEHGAPLLVGSSPWVQVSYDPWAMLDGRFDLKEIVVAQPRLQLRRRVDGSWNFLGLLADPWPLPPSETSPPIRIENGTVDLIDEADGPDAAPATVLRDVSVTVSPGDLRGTPVRFEAKATGDLCEGVRLSGTIDRATGRVSLAGDLARLAFSNTLAERLPMPAREAFRRMNLIGGEADVALRSLTYDPKAAEPFRYDAGLQLRGGVWQCDRLPFPVNDLSAAVLIRDGSATIEWSEGRNGPTVMRAAGTVGLGAPERTPFQLGIEIVGLELDERTRAWSSRTFPRAANLWSDFRPSGRVDLETTLARAAPGGPIDWGIAATLRDVAMEYKEFRYPLEHVAGALTARPGRVTADLRSLVGGKPMSVRGSVEGEGAGAVVDLDFAAESLPIDRDLLDAMPADVRNVVLSFKPAGTVRGTAHLHRTPARPGEDPKGTIAIHADLDINPGSEITWEGLQYPVRDLTGHLEIHPSSWIFTGMKGTHGQAAIAGEGRVDKLPGGFKVGLHIHAEDLLCESQLRAALRPAWQKTWDTLNPLGASDVDVTIAVEPGKPDHYHLEILPRPGTNLKLRFERVAIEGDGGGPKIIEMPMEDVRGRFVFDDGVVTMTGGKFSFHSAPVEFAWGEVRVFDSGQFALRVRDMTVDDFKLDARLRKLMPPLMAQFALRLDDGKVFRLRGDLALGWSGKAGEVATCSWENGAVYFVDNTIKAGIPLEHVQGQLDHVRGSFDGRNLVVSGALELLSVNLLGVHVTELTTPIEVRDGRASLTSLKGTLMGGEITGSLAVGLESTPKFEAHLAVEGADLRDYARSLPGKQGYRGKVSGRVDLSGLGGDLHTLQGGGEAHVAEGDLGKLPLWTVLIKGLNLAPATKTAFDQADVWFTIRNGMTTFNPIEFFGDAFSLHGRGTLDVQGEIDAKLRVLYSRDAWHIPGVSDLIREAEGQLLVIHVTGPAVAPAFKLEFIPGAVEFAKSLGARRGPQPPREPTAPRPRLPFVRRRTTDDVPRP